MIYTDLTPLSKCIFTDLGNEEINNQSVGYVAYSRPYNDQSNLTKVVLTRIGKGGKDRCHLQEFRSSPLLTTTAEESNFVVLFARSKPLNMLTAPNVEFAAWAAAWAIMLEDTIGNTYYWGRLKGTTFRAVLSACKTNSLHDWEALFETPLQRIVIIERLRYISQFVVRPEAELTKESRLKRALINKYRYIRNRRKKGEDVEVLWNIIKTFVTPEMKVEETKAFKQIFVESAYVEQQYEDSGNWV